MTVLLDMAFTKLQNKITKCYILVLLLSYTAHSSVLLHTTAIEYDRIAKSVITGLGWLRAQEVRQT